MKNLLKDYLLLIIGSILSSFATVALLIPNNFGSGGVTGIALCLNQLFGTKIGLMTIIINIPLFVFGFKLLGNKFAIRSAFVVFLSSVIFDFMNAKMKFPPMDDKLLAAVLFGALLGASIYMIFISSGSTGGLDISAKIICSKHKSKQLSTVLLVQDIAVYILVAIIMGPKSVIYAVIASFIRSKTIDAIQETIAASKQCIIICENSDKLIAEINAKLSRGVTVLNAVGGYTSNDKKFIYVVVQMQELNVLRNIVNSIEPSAFVTISPVTNILGNFRQELTL